MPPSPLTEKHAEGIAARPRNGRYRPPPTARRPRRKRASKNCLSRSSATTPSGIETAPSAERYRPVRDTDDDRDRDDDYDRDR
jgi:hypothetical protein